MAMPQKLEDRFANLRNQLQNEDFLRSRGLGNEVNIRLFQYRCQEEANVREFLRSLGRSHLSSKVHCYDLWDVFLTICQREGFLETAAELEAEEGTEELVEALQEAIGPESIVEELHAENLRVGEDVILLHGIGRAYPFVRIHQVLQQLPNHCQVPVVVFYPGLVHNQELKLFELLPANSYYRCFTDI